MGIKWYKSSLSASTTESLENGHSRLRCEQRLPTRAAARTPSTQLPLAPIEPLHLGLALAVEASLLDEASAELRERGSEGRRSCAASCRRRARSRVRTRG